LIVSAAILPGPGGEHTPSDRAGQRIDRRMASVGECSSGS
jgi:hypothetical protein